MTRITRRKLLKLSGGSALAAAAVNALILGRDGEAA